jgi:hypothetical protein
MIGTLLGAAAVTYCREFPAACEDFRSASTQKTLSFIVMKPEFQSFISNNEIQVKLKELRSIKGFRDRQAHLDWLTLVPFTPLSNFKNWFEGHFSTMNKWSKGHVFNWFIYFAPESVLFPVKNNN